jgi:hypothetical protein
MPTPQIDDARQLFDNYIELSRDLNRSVPENDYFRYPYCVNEQDMMVFASMFTNVWQAIRRDFAAQYDTKRKVFLELEHLTTPNQHCQHNAFWIQKGPALEHRVVTDVDGMRLLCRTLRNGFNHFNYRYADMAPNDYFKRLGVQPPAGIPHLTTTSNYRIFICDHKARTVFMARDSETRVLETGFGHLRYHLYAFLARFFEAEGGRPYLDLFELRAGRPSP